MGDIGDSRDFIVLSVDEINRRMEYFLGVRYAKDKFSYNEILSFLAYAYFYYDAMVEFEKNKG